MSGERREFVLATRADARRVAEAHVRARRSAYRALMPAELLAAESVDDRERRWVERLSDPEGRCWLVHDAAALMGFAYTAPTRDTDVGSACAELFALYLVPEGIGRGLGRAVTSHALRDLAERGFAEVVLWYAEQNLRAGRFYAIAGFEVDPRTAAVPFGDTGLTRRRLRRALTG